MTDRELLELAAKAAAEIIGDILWTSAPKRSL